MKTVQIYRTGDSCATSSDQTAKNATSTVKSGVLLHVGALRHSLQLHTEGNFADRIGDTERMQLLREAVRCWFMAWVSDWEGSPGPNLTDSMRMYQDLDEFLSDLVIVSAQYQQEPTPSV